MRMHLVFGGKPAGAATAQETGRLIDRGRAEHDRARRDKDRSPPRGWWKPVYHLDRVGGHSMCFRPSGTRS